MSTQAVSVKPELEKISVELCSSAWRRPTLSLPQISGQRLISSNLHSLLTGKNLNLLKKRRTEDQEIEKVEEEEEEEVAVEATEVAEEEEEEAEAEVAPDQEVEHEPSS